MGEMERVTQQNASSSEESSSAASELSVQACELSTMVAGFRLHGTSSTAPAGEPAAPSPPAPRARGYRTEAARAAAGGA
jgi:methyl-accepting chemotaxis protein